MDDQQQPRRWLTRKRVLWTVCIISVIVGGYFVLRFAYVREWKWMGLVEDPDYHKRTLWDWLNLLVVPAVLALGGYLFTRSENRRTREDADQQRTLDRQLADQRRQDDMLQAYLDGMSELLSDEKRPLHRAELGDRLSTVARARTLTVLSRLDGERKGNVVQFFYESGLIFGRRPVLTLRDANLRGANLIGADLRKADLRVTNLSDADLYKADLRRANLPCAFLIGDDLRHAYLRNADLYYANLSGARLYKADLEGASLVNANLRAAVGLTDEQLLKTKSLQGATMPNGQKYEDWLKDREHRGKDGEDASP